VNHSSGSVQYQHPFEENSTAAADPFMTSVQVQNFSNEKLKLLGFINNG